MKTCIAAAVCLILLAAVQSCSCGAPTDWARTAKTPRDRADLYEATETGFPLVGTQPAGPSEDTLQRVGPLSWVNKGETLIAYGVRLGHTDFAIGEGDENILLFTSGQYLSGEQMWIDNVERKGNNFVVHMQHAQDTGWCGSAGCYRAAFAVNLGKLSQGEYSAQWVIDPLGFTEEDEDGWPEDAQSAATEWNKQIKLQIKFSVVAKTTGGPAVPPVAAQPELIGTEKDLQKAIKSAQAIALCRATDYPYLGPTCLPQPTPEISSRPAAGADMDGGILLQYIPQYLQTFVVLKECKGQLGDSWLNGVADIDYATQRQVKRGQEVLLLLKEADPDNNPHYCYILKALPDTPENRKLVGAPAAPASQPAHRWAQKARQPGLTRTQKAVYKQLAQMHLYNLLMDNPDGLGSGFPAPGTPDPPGELQQSGFDAVPFLVEALDDTTMTRTVSADGRDHRYQVNEVVGYTIERICNHQFVLDDEPDPNQRFLDYGIRQRPDLVPRFQKLILAWYKAQCDKPEVERKLADVDHNNLRVRLDAVEWLGTNKVALAAAPISKHIDRTLAEMEKSESSDDQAEISECAAALGQIGDRDSLPAVRRACRHMFEHSPGNYTNSVNYLFMAYHAVAQLGAKDEALKDLRSLYESKKGRMEEQTRHDYQKQLDMASNWEEVPSTQPATAPATRPATAPATAPASRPAGALSVKERESMLIAAVNADPIDYEKMRLALTDVANVEFSFWKGPLDEAPDRNNLPRGVSAQWDGTHHFLCIVDGLNRTERGTPLQEWIGRFTGPREDGYLLRRATLVIAPTEEIVKERDRLLKEAAAKIRKDLLAMAPQFPRLEETIHDETLAQQLEAKDPEAPWLLHIGVRLTPIPNARPTKGLPGMSVVFKPVYFYARGQDTPAADWFPWPDFDNLALEGAAGSYSGDAKLDEAANKIINDALAPLRELNKKAALANAGAPAETPAAAPATQPATPASRPALPAVQTAKPGT